MRVIVAMDVRVYTVCIIILSLLFEVHGNYYEGIITIVYVSVDC